MSPPFQTAADVAEAPWESLRAVYDELLARPLGNATIEAWLADWSRFEEVLTEAISLAMIGYTSDTTDPKKAAAHRRFAVEIGPLADEKSVALARRLGDFGYRRPGLEQVVARFRRATEVFREENVPLIAELEEAGTEYQAITGGFLVDWDGEQRPVPQLAPFLQSPDRAIRERAFRASTQPYKDARQSLAALFDRQLGLRHRVARHAGFADFREYSFAAKCRFDYGPDDCERFHAAVEAVVVPAVARLYRDRQARLGLQSLRPWDLGSPLYREEPLRPFQGGRDLMQRTAAVFRHLDPVLAGEFQLMIDEGLLDLESRKGKAPGGYCDTLHARGYPFIFMNASGVMEDVQTLLHEAGHSFHAFASHRQALIWQRHPSAESAELASMSMELLGTTFLDAEGAFLGARDAAVARIEHLEDVLVTLCHIASVDAFQAWIYPERRGDDAGARDRAWLAVRARFEPVVNWDGLETERVARWYRQLHIFLHPFYYIEYGIAQLGALQVWLNYRRDPVGALASYRRFLSMGATAALPALYQAAGAELVFEAGPMARLVGEVEAEIDRLRASLG